MSYTAARIHCALLIALALGCASLPLQAQLSSGSISGLVTDPAGAIVAGAKVQVKNLATGILRDTTTNETGLYVFTGMLPARYELAVQAPGFKEAVRTGIELLVNQGMRVDVPLQLGEIAQKVEVAGSAAPLIESASA